LDRWSKGPTGRKRSERLAAARASDKSNASSGCSPGGTTHPGKAAQPPRSRPSQGGEVSTRRDAKARRPEQLATAHGGQCPLGGAGERAICRPGKSRRPKRRPLAGGARAPRPRAQLGQPPSEGGNGPMDRGRVPWDRPERQPGRRWKAVARAARGAAGHRGPSPGAICRASSPLSKLRWPARRSLNAAQRKARSGTLCLRCAAAPSRCFCARSYT